MSDWRAQGQRGSATIRTCTVLCCKMATSGMISSQIHNELRCVSIGGTAHQSNEATRKVAQEWLVAATEAETSYQATVVVQEKGTVPDHCTDETEGTQEEIPCTVFRLETRSMSGAEVRNSTADGPMLYALAASDGAESIMTAHERDMANLRDIVSAASGKNIETLWTPRPWENIVPAESYTELAADVPEVDAMEVEATTTTSLPSSYTTKKKVTNAASFFANKGKAASSRKPKNTKVTKSKPDAGRQDEKENNQQSQSEADDVVVGNADDFCGDVEESDDEEDETPVLVRRATRRVIDDDEEDEKEKAPVKPKKSSPRKSKKVKEPVQSGAMDTFATAKPSSATTGATSNPRRRRRKVMKEKTTVDENGYLHTETQEVWEEVSEDEAAAKSLPVASSKKPPVAKKKFVAGAKKQKSLAGFFKKK